MIRPQLAADGRAVRLADDRPDVLLDELAAAYARNPDTLAALLAEHADALDALDHAQANPDATDYGRAMRAAEADGTRDALYGELPSPAVLDHILTPDEAITLGTRLTRRAAYIRHTARNRNRA